jgi:parvulin-like peptidyl-prolyl isomerase
MPAALDAAPASYVESSFGAAFTDALGELPLGSWQGPVTSTFGAHLVLLRERSGGTPLDFSAARAHVERDWLYEETAATRERFYEELRAQYRIDDASQRGAVTP